MKILGLVTLLFGIISSVASALPTCEQARQSQDLKNKTLVQILSESGKIKVRGEVLLEQGKALVAKIRAGQIEREEGLRQLNEIKAQSAKNTARGEALQALMDCINRGN